MCVFSSHPFWTSSSLDVPAGVTQEEGHTGFLCIHLTLSACSLYRYSVDIRTLHGHGCTCNGAKQIKIKCPSCRCNHAIHMVPVLFFERNS